MADLRIELEEQLKPRNKWILKPEEAEDFARDKSSSCLRATTDSSTFPQIGCL
jgi:hypothetical protein